MLPKLPIFGLPNFFAQNLATFFKSCYQKVIQKVLTAFLCHICGINIFSSWKFSYLMFLVPDKAKSSSQQNKKLQTLGNLVKRPDRETIWSELGPLKFLTWGSDIRWPPPRKKIKLNIFFLRFPEEKADLSCWGRLR